MLNKNDKLETKKENEKKVIFLMIKIYCKDNHKKNNKNDKECEICEECQNVYNYACIRIDKCRYMETKTFCSACKTPCYNKEMKDKIKNIMSYSGKRMLLYNPIKALRHVFVMIMHKKKNNKLDFKGVL